MKKVQYSVTEKDAETAANRKLYISRIWMDVCDDIHTGMLLERILYWFMPNKDGSMKVKVVRNKNYWIVKTRQAWSDELRIKPRQYDKALRKLKDLGLIEVIYAAYGNARRVTHIRVNYEQIEKVRKEWKESYIEQQEQKKAVYDEAEVKAAVAYEKAHSVFFKESENYCEDIAETIKKAETDIELIEPAFEPTAEPTLIPTEKQEKAKVVSKDTMPTEKPENSFEKLWNVYPNKMDKLQALNEYLKIRKQKTVSDDVIMESIKSYSEYVADTPKQFIKKFSSFLKYKCWENDYSKPDTVAKKSDTSYKDYEVFTKDNYDYAEIERKSSVRICESMKVPV